MQHIVTQIRYLVSLCQIFIRSVRWEPAILSLLVLYKVCNCLSYCIALVWLCWFWTSPSFISSESSHAQQDVDIVVLCQKLFFTNSVILNKSWPNACCRNFIANTQVVFPSQSVTFIAVNESKGMISANCANPKTLMILYKMGIYTET